MRRDHALEILKHHVSDEIVVAVYQTLFDWMAINPRDLNYVATGAMGQASSHGLGLALANPQKEVLVFDGDGSLLMNLGSLVSVANAKPANFHHFVFVNRVYEVNGAHPIPGAESVDFSAMASAAGYKQSVSFSNIETFESNISDFLATPGPSFAALYIEAGDPYPRDYDYIHSAEARDKFRLALASS
ncbi:MAG: sulfopyruvate decarboxylase subunit beta [Gammaproteobacteria bacterium]|jgi:sulfopyruvate decarboxylase subunit beta